MDRGKWQIRKHLSHNKVKPLPLMREETAVSKWSREVARGGCLHCRTCGLSGEGSCFLVTICNSFSPCLWSRAQTLSKTLPGKKI